MANFNSINTLFKLLKLKLINKVRFVFGFAQRTKYTSIYMFVALKCVHND